MRPIEQLAARVPMHPAPMESPLISVVIPTYRRWPGRVIACSSIEGPMIFPVPHEMCCPNVERTWMICLWANGPRSTAPAAVTDPLASCISTMDVLKSMGRSVPRAPALFLCMYVKR